MILISDNCNCGETCVGGLTCHCNDTTTFICPGGNCSIPNNNNNCGCNCNCCIPDSTLPETHRVQRLIAPSRDTHTNWNDKDPVIKEGVLGFTKDRLFNGSLEYFIGDGVHKYSELTKYAAAPASTSNDPNTLVLRDANGKIDSSSIDFPTVPDATPTTKGIVKASTTKAADNAVKSDANGGLDGWKDAIIDAIIADDGSGGLATDNNGNMIVDFNQMPTDKFEALLKSLKMLVPLTAHKYIYVDKNHSNTGDNPDSEIEISGITYHRGDEQLPFETIQAAVDFVTGTYALGNYNVYIKIKAGTYQENVTLPSYSRGTGGCFLASNSGNQSDVVIEPPIDTNTGTRLTGISAGGGVWQLNNLTVRRVENPTTDTTADVGCYHSSGNNTILAIFGCAAISEVPDNLDFTDKKCSVSLFRATLGGTIRLYKDPTPGLIQCEQTVNGPTITVIEVSRNGELVLHKTGTARTINVEGSCTTFLSMSQMSRISSLSSGSLISFTDVNSNFSGKRYSLTTGSTGLGGLSTTYFPGDEAGTVDNGEDGRPQTFCWYN